MLRAKITGTGSYAPDKLLTNKDLERIVETSEEWILERTGIRQRHIAAKDQTTSDLAVEAARQALKAAGVKARDIDLIIVGTCTPDMFLPSTACMVQLKLNAKNAAAFDLNAACSGFLYGLSVASSYISSGAYKKILVIGAETLSRFTDWQDRSTCILFGDGAGAVVLEPTTGSNAILFTHIKSDAEYWDYIQIPGGAATKPATRAVVDKRLTKITMKGNETFKVAVKTLESLVVETLEKCNLKPSQLSLLIPHQANLRIIQATAKRLGLPMDKVMLNLERYGNTSAASIPIALDEAVRTGRVREGDYILLEAFGAGLTWASALVKW
ncbi:MAG TPA: beta-ketoacyl-ACP synthase III [Dissulfurispiraceae bacterium]|nr:beta-ketoacyl-ACP synthase III [Dissulfurispiraceae bacterium]